MANQEHLDILKQGSEIWNAWKKNQRSKFQPDLSSANLKGADLHGANLSKTNLKGADLRGANLHGANFEAAALYGADLRGANLSKAILRIAFLREANLEGANLEGANLANAKPNGAILTRTNLINAKLNGAILTGANLHEANLEGANLRSTLLNRADCSSAILRRVNLTDTDLRGTDLRDADLSGADLSGQDLSNKDLSGANLRGAKLIRANMVSTNLTNTILIDCSVYGISACDIKLEGAQQFNLRITPDDQPGISVDNLKVAQFIYLLLNNAEIRDVIDTITSKVVLILGRFTPERKTNLDALRDELRKRNYLPVLFDFEKPASRDITETLSTLAHIARFVIADITDARSIPQELTRIVPNLPSVPVQPLILTSQHEYGMFEHFTRFPWVLPVYRYTDEADLLQSLQEKVIAPAEQQAQELEKR